MTKQVKQFIFWVGALVIGAVLSASVYEGVAQDKIQGMGSSSYLDYFISAIPNNIIYPFVSGNVLSILIVSFIFGFAISNMKESEKKTAVNIYSDSCVCAMTNKDLKNEVEVSA